MYITQALFFLILFKSYFCDDNTDKLFENINKNTAKFNTIAADIAWESSINPGNPDLPLKSASYQKKRIRWQHETCDKLATMHNSHLLNSTQARQTYLLCRGPKYTFNEARLTSNIYEELQTIYSEAEICIPSYEDISVDNITAVEDVVIQYLSTTKKASNIDSIAFAAKIAAKETTKGKNVVCLKGEADFEKLMAYSRNEEILRWVWLAWREKVGPPMKEPYSRLVDVENQAARRNGYPNIGASWRDDLEIPDLRKLCRRLYDTIRPLYTLLHGVVRFYLRRQYGEVVSKHGPIPAHLLGNLWSQNWEPLADLILPKSIDLDKRMKELNWTVIHMVKRAEDYYESLGLPAMTETFWRHSVFTRERSKTRCHGAAADMFKDGDFRLLYCSGTSKEDFYVLHHEMGHIQYYMAYARQPALFRQANTAFHETIGDTIMYGVMTPQHLHRLGLINDSALYNSNNLNFKENPHKITSEIKNKQKPETADDKIFKFDSKAIRDHLKILDSKEDEDIIEATTDDVLILKQALNKLPQIPFSLLIDEYRWKYFEGSLDNDASNREFWQMSMELLGIEPPGDRGEEYFDIGAKFHVPDNTPFIRYFLSSFLEHQLFETLCKAAVFGRRHVQEALPVTIAINRCDIYGSKTAGKILMDFMGRGSSQHWSEILQETTGASDISASALKRYYRPLFKLLGKLVRVHRIPIGW